MTSANPVWAATPTRDTPERKLYGTQLTPLTSGKTSCRQSNSDSETLWLFLASSNRPASRPEAGSAESQGEGWELLGPLRFTADIDRQPGKSWLSRNTDQSDSLVVGLLLFNEPAGTSLLLSTSGDGGATRPAPYVCALNPHLETAMSRQLESLVPHAGLLSTSLVQCSQQPSCSPGYQTAQGKHTLGVIGGCSTAPGQADHLTFIRTAGKITPLAQSTQPSPLESS